MATTKKLGRKPAAKRKPGRPSKFHQGYHADFVELGRKLALLGHTDEQIAVVFGVATSTVSLWKVKHKEFSEALNAGKDRADAQVADRLLQRAMGYEHDEVDIRVVSGEIVMTPIRKIYPPDTTAAIFWLKNRQKAQWRDRIDTELTGRDGGPIQTEELSQTDIARRIAYALAQGMKQKEP